MLRKNDGRLSGDVVGHQLHDAMSLLARRRKCLTRFRNAEDTASGSGAVIAPRWRFASESGGKTPVTRFIGRRNL
jgi:hypothetical protein